LQPPCTCRNLRFLSGHLIEFGSEGNVYAFANVPISRKLVAAFAAVIAVIFVSSAIVYDRLRIIEDARNWRVHTSNVLDALHDATDAMLQQETGMRGYVFSGDKTFLERYHRGGNAFTAALRKIVDLTADDSAQQKRLNELNELTDAWRSKIAEPRIALMAQPETQDQAIGIEEARANRTAMDVIRAKVDEISRAERALLVQRSAAEHQAYVTAYLTTIVGGAVALIIAMVMWILLTRGITVPISRMTLAMKGLANGDISVKVPGVGRGDEIGAMAAAVRIFRDSIIERQKAQTELAHVNRVATVGQLTASIAHEVSQPIAAAVINAQAALRFLGTQPPALDDAREAVIRIAGDGQRAGDILSRIRVLFKNGPPRKEQFDLNEAIQDVIAVIRSEVLHHGVSLQTQLASGLPPVAGERIQLQQVMLNLTLNAVEAMAGLDEGIRELHITTEMEAAGGVVLVAVLDSGPGLDPTNVEHVFDPFYTTKPDGMGMGLSICRSIIAAHGGRMWATARQPRGALFQFTIPAG
jgi:C4-dicarboxylate-specific signal transduction histidine kinase